MLPWELLLTAEGDSLVGKLQAFEPSWVTWMSVVTSLKASKIEDAVLGFIETRLKAVTTGRRWRSLLLDAYSVHSSERVRKDACQKECVVVIHGGGASRVTHVTCMRT